MGRASVCPFPFNRVKENKAMTVQEFLAALNNPNAVVTVTENDGTELIKLYAAGYQQLVHTLLGREIAQVTVVNPQAITVKLAPEGSF